MYFDTAIMFAWLLSRPDMNCQGLLLTQRRRCWQERRKKRRKVSIHWRRKEASSTQWSQIQASFLMFLFLFFDPPPAEIAFQLLVDQKKGEEKAFTLQ